MDIKAQRKTNNIVVISLPSDSIDVQRSGREVRLVFTQSTAKMVCETLIGALPTLEPFTSVN